MILGFSQDGACTDLLENLSMNGLKGVLSNASTSNPPLFSLVNTLHGVLEIVKLYFLSKEKLYFISLKFFSFLVIKTLDQDWIGIRIGAGI